MRVPLTFLPLPVCLPPCLAVYVRILAMCSLVSYHREEGGRGRKACHPCFLLVLLFVPPPPPPDMSACDAKKEVSPNFLSGIYFSLPHLGAPLS